MLEVRVFHGQLDLTLILSMDYDSELEQVYSFSPLDDLVVELGTDEGPVDVGRVLPTSIRLLIAKQEVVQVVICFRPTILERSPLCLHHENDQNQIAEHVHD